MTTLVIVLFGLPVAWLLALVFLIVVYGYGEWRAERRRER